MSNINDYTPSARSFTGRQMLLIMLAFFGVIITVNVTMVRFATSSFGGLVVENSYVASQRFEADRSAALAQPIAEWKIAVQSVAGEQLRLSITNAGQPVREPVLTARALRPTHGRDAVSLELHATPKGHTADRPLPAGLWDLTLETADGQLRTVRILVAEQRP